MHLVHKVMLFLRSENQGRKVLFAPHADYDQLNELRGDDQGFDEQLFDGRTIPRAVRDRPLIVWLEADQVAPLLRALDGRRRRRLQWALAGTALTVAGCVAGGLYARPPSAVTYTPAADGCVLRFDGRSGAVRVAIDGPFPSSPDCLTIAAWVRPERWYHDQYFPIVDRGWRIDATPDGTAFVAGYGRAASASALPLRQWTHIAVSYNRHVGEARWFVNGVFDRAVPYDDQIIDVSTHPLAAENRNRNNAAHALYLGAGPTGGSEFADGYLDDVRLWSRALQPEEVRSAAEGKRVPEGLVGAWSFDECTGRVVGDASGAGWKGILEGDAQWVPAPSTVSFETR